jgi:hypothetical protein
MRKSEVVSEISSRLKDAADPLESWFSKVKAMCSDLIEPSNIELASYRVITSAGTSG